jgi:CBS-domain-containing membrane protein
VITANDLLSLYEPGEHPTTVANLMSASIITAAPDLALADAAKLMLEHEVHRLVVIDPTRSHGAPIGIISTEDIIAEMAHERSVWQREAPTGRLPTAWRDCPSRSDNLGQRTSSATGAAVSITGR